MRSWKRERDFVLADQGLQQRRGRPASRPISIHRRNTGCPRSSGESLRRPQPALIRMDEGVQKRIEQYSSNDLITVAGTKQRRIMFTNKVGCSALARRWLSGLVTLGMVVFVVPGVSAQTAGVTNRPILYYIPHTHWEGAVFKTREGYLEMGLPHILKALQLLKQYPDYKFTLDQVAYFKPFLERYPEEAAAFRKFVNEGRLEIVGGMDVMPDDVKPGGELFIRQMQYGKSYCREQLGVDVKVAWLLDTFGHHAQMPQLLRKAGFESFWFCRGVPNNKLLSEFFWRGIDGTEIPAFWLPGFYGLFYGPPRQPAEFAKFFANRFNSLTPHVAGTERVRSERVKTLLKEFG